MKFPQIIESFFQKKAKKSQAFISLYLDSFQVAASFWLLDGNGAAKILASEHANLPKDSWQERIGTVDRLLGLLEQKTGHTEVSKCILGLPPAYLTATGEIRKDVRIEIKNFTKELELEAIGFVPLQQSVIYKMKKDEGVPPSVILLGINGKTIAIGIYKIGELVGVRDVETHDDVVASVEQGLKSFTDLEVLPARILLYGSHADELEEAKSKLLKHQWTSRVNFLHFPKIETISLPLIIESISLAGASELGASMESAEAENGPESEEEPETDGETTAPVAEVAEPESQSEEEVQEEILESSQSVEEIAKSPLEETKPHIAVADGTPDELKDQQAHVSEELAEAQEAISEDFAVDEVTSQDANVVMVDAESLGFKKDVDVLEEEHAIAEESAEESTEDEEEYEEDQQETAGKWSGFSVRSLFGSSGWAPRIAIIVGILVLLLLGYAYYWFIPHVTLTILQVPKSLDTVKTITIDPGATTTDAENFIVPGRKREKSVSGENTIPVNGKKSIGDPARGTVTIYNKSLSSRSFKKGNILVSGSLQFTLDGDVLVASASESIGSITFGKADVAVTAASIGAQSNLASGTEFTFKDVSSSTAIARNDKAFTGGNSRDITVVSRADYDAFVKLESEELVGKAKGELAKTVENSEKLIDATVKTTVTEKVFSQEIDQEAKQLQGKLTLSVSGIAFSDSDIKALLTNVSSENIPSGYVVNDEKTTLTVTDVQVKKDGKITATARMTALALPKLDAEQISKTIAGISFVKAQEYLKTLPGVGGIKIDFTNAPFKTRLPINRKNISVIFSIFQ